MIIINERKKVTLNIVLRVAFVTAIIILLNLTANSYAKELNYEYYDTVAIASYDKVEKVVKDSYIKGVEKSSDNNIDGLFEQLDEHSKYYDKKEFNSFLNDLNGDLGEIGVLLSESDSGLVVDSVKDNSPADKAGIETGSILLEANGVSMKDKSVSEGFKQIVGARDSKVSVKLAKDGKQVKKELKRSLAFNKDVSSNIIEGIGYIKILQFNKQSHNAVSTIVKEMEKSKITKVIIDVRNNRGGYLDQSIKIAELFVPKGPVVHVDYGKARGSITYTSFSTSQKFQNVIALTNGNTASASEVLVGAIKDRKVGTIVGEKTYGKGTIQEIIKLDSGEGMKITVAEYFSPGKSKIDGVGITPDIVVKNTDKDYQLLKAIELLSK